MLKILQKPKVKHMKSNIYYSDFARFEHDPPGHTCGLPCCREDANVHIKQPSSSYSCMPVQEKILDDNFTFRIKRYGLISGRPTFSNKFFSLQNINSDDTSRQRRPIPEFNELLGNVGPKSPDVILTDSLENPFVLQTRPGLRKGEYMCRREICLPDSPELNRKIFFSDYEIGESLDFDDGEDGTIEYYTTTPENGMKIDTAAIKVVKRGIQDEEMDGHDNQGFSHGPNDVTDTLTSSEHYYDVLDVISGNKENAPSPARLYPDLSDFQVDERPDTFSVFKNKYVNTLARKRTEPKLLPVPVQTKEEKYDTYPGRKSPQESQVPDYKINRFHLWNQVGPHTDNYYEDIDFKPPHNKNADDNLTKSDDITGENARNSFGSFGYDGDKSPSKPEKILDKKGEIKDEKSKRQDSLKDSPITLIL